MKLARVLSSPNDLHTNAYSTLTFSELLDFCELSSIFFLKDNNQLFRTDLRIFAHLLKD